MKMPQCLFRVEPWSAFKGNYPPGSTVAHRIIIVYKDCGVVRYFYVTSQVEKMRRAAGDDIGSLVDKINSKDWDVLTMESCILCNSIYMYETCEEEIRRAYDDEKLEYLGKVPEIIKNKIIAAICASESFTEEQKVKYTRQS